MFHCKRNNWWLDLRFGIQSAALNSATLRITISFRIRVESEEQSVLTLFFLAYLAQQVRYGLRFRGEFQITPVSVDCVDLEVIFFPHFKFSIPLH